MHALDNYNIFRRVKKIKNEKCAISHVDFIFKTVNMYYCLPSNWHVYITWEEHNDKLS